MAGNIQDIINPSGDPVVSILIPAAAITSKIVSWIGAEVGFLEPLMISENGAHLPRPGMLNAEISRNCSLDFISIGIHQYWLNAEKRSCCGTRFGFGRSR